MTALRVVGVDPGLRNSGVAELTYDGHRCTTLTTRLEESHPPANPSAEQTAARMTRMIRAVAPAGERTTCEACGHTDTATPHDVVLVVLESLAPHAKDRNADSNAGYWWRLRSILVSRGIPVATCNPGTLKRWAANHGHASDAQMKMALDRYWPGARARTDHEVDAALLALAGAQFLRWWDGGEPLRQAPELAKMTWPRLPERVGAGR